jgi:hypothetical protein
MDEAMIDTADFLVLSAAIKKMDELKFVLPKRFQDRIDSLRLDIEADIKAYSSVHRDFVLTNEDIGTIRTRLKKIVCGYFIGESSKNRNNRRIYKRLINMCNETRLDDRLINDYIYIRRRNRAQVGPSCYYMTDEVLKAANDISKTQFLQFFIETNKEQLKQLNLI